MPLECIRSNLMFCLTLHATQYSKLFFIIHLTFLLVFMPLTFPKQMNGILGYMVSGLHKLWYPGIRDMSTWSKLGAHGEHGDVFLLSNLGAL